MNYWIRWGSDATASTRLRVNKISPFIPDHSFELPATYAPGDVLIVQKDPGRVEEMRKARAQGAATIYDIDDNWLDRADVQGMIAAADVVTAGSAALQRQIPGSILMDDALDDSGVRKTDYANGKKIGWTGYGPGAAYINAVMPLLIRQGYSFRIISGTDAHQYIRYPHEFYEWRLDTVDQLLAECDLCVYYLPPNDAFAQSKGMNRALKAWSIGLPALLSPMPEYLRAVSESGIDSRCIVTDWSQVPEIRFEPKMREYAMTFAPERQAEKWLAVIEIARNALPVGG